VRGKRNVSAEINSMELERDKGITVQMRRRSVIGRQSLRLPVNSD
jgi:hypothetical protein